MSAEGFQSGVAKWVDACFGAAIAGDKVERNHRFLEEALELVQALGCTAGEAHQLVEYTFGRPTGYAPQEVGGVMVTLAALCLANDMHMEALGTAELARVWTKVEQIREKQKRKPQFGPLPGSYPDRIQTASSNPAGYAEYWKEQHDRLPEVLREHVVAVLQCEAEPHVIADAVAAVREAANIIEMLQSREGEVK
jgi:hypothetical protein